MGRTPAGEQAGNGTSRRAAFGTVASFCLLAATAGACSRPSDRTSPGEPAPPDNPPGGSVARFLADTGDIPVGGGRILGWVLVVQPTAGTFAAFSAVCPHRGARVSPPENGVMTCYEHTSLFRMTDGAVIAGPTPTGLTAIPITVDGTAIYRT